MKSLLQTVADVMIIAEGDCKEESLLPTTLKTYLPVGVRLPLWPCGRTLLRLVRNSAGAVARTVQYPLRCRTHACPSRVLPRRS